MVVMKDVLGRDNRPFLWWLPMTQQATIVAQMRQLIQILAQHNHAYYVMDQPSISDSEYDQLFHQLKALEDKYP